MLRRIPLCRMRGTALSCVEDMLGLRVPWSSPSRSATLQSMAFLPWGHSRSLSARVETRRSGRRRKRGRRGVNSSFNIHQKPYLMPITLGTNIHRRGSRLSAPKHEGVFRVVIVGRPNVGKSTLYNRLTKRNKAIVTPIAGTTRDLKEEMVSFAGMEFEIIDTGGLEDGADTERAIGGMPNVILRKTEEAMSAADVVFFVVDARKGITESDNHYARWIRKRQGEGRHVYMVANKTEGHLTEDMLNTLEDCKRLGFGEVLAISAEHGDGMGELAAAIVPHYNLWEEQSQAMAMTAEEEKEESGEEGMEASPVQMALVGRPNVGKSSILNAILNEERALTGPVPGLTRDAVAVEWTWGGKPVRLVDTAGIRKSGKRDTSTPLEELAVQDAMNAIRKAQVVVLVLDGAEGILRKTELTIASMVAEEGRALVVAGNKSDLVEIHPKDYAKGVMAQVEALMPDMRKPPVVSVCALSGGGISNLMRVVMSSRERWRRRVSTALLNRWLRKVSMIHPPPRDSRTKSMNKLKYLTQVKRGPPEFRLFVNNLSLPEQYQRYLTKNLQAEFGFEGMAVRMSLRKPPNVYDRPAGSDPGVKGVGRKKAIVGKKGRRLPLPPSPTRYRPNSHK